MCADEECFILCNINGGFGAAQWSLMNGSENGTVFPELHCEGPKGTLNSQMGWLQKQDFILNCHVIIN